MPFIVSKFGGTSLCSGEMFLRVRDIVKSDPARRIVVVSAPGKRSDTDMKITDLLLRLHEEKNISLFYALEERFLEIAEKVRLNIDHELLSIRQDVLEGESREYVVSRGEWLSAKIMAGCLGYPFLDAKDLVSFSGGHINEITYANIEKAFDQYGKIVLPGFYGADETGSVRLFPRGGSDITGAIAAAAVNADKYENWTDVDGVYDSDPNKNPDAKLLSDISFDEMRSLCNRGAFVLHPESLEPVMRSGICVEVRNTKKPHKSGTLIRPEHA